MKPHPTKSKPRKAPGHNPDLLTVEQVGKGWRLLTFNEIVPERCTPRPGVEMWCKENKLWQPGNWSVDSVDCTYRMKLAVGIAKPSPRQPGKGGRVMWEHPANEVFSRVILDNNTQPDATPVLVLDLSPGARERRVETVARLLNKQSDDHAPIWVYMAKARAVLASLGDTPANEGRGK